MSPQGSTGRRTIFLAGIGLVVAASALWWGRPAAAPNVVEAVPEPTSQAAPSASNPTAGIAADSTAAAKSSKSSDESKPPSAAGEKSKPDKLILGEWEQTNKGKRLLNVLQNGTATMSVALEGPWAAVVGDKLEFQIEWKIENERLLFKMTGGKPEGSLKLISSIYGNERNHRIESLTDDTMILVDEKDNSRDTWTRVASAKH
jgi:hypothetical protein